MTTLRVLLFGERTGDSDAEAAVAAKERAAVDGRRIGAVRFVGVQPPTLVEGSLAGALPALVYEAAEIPLP